MSMAILSERDIPTGYEINSYPTQTDRNLAEFLWCATGDTDYLCEVGKAPPIEKDEVSLCLKIHERLRERSVF